MRAPHPQPRDDIARHLSDPCEPERFTYCIGSMTLNYRKRGKVWHCRGTVRIGRRSVEVPEFSTGANTKADAETIGAAEEARIRAEFLSNGVVPALPPVRVITVRLCIAAYKARPGGLHKFDVSRLDELDAAMGTTPLAEVREAWGEWVRDRGADLAPSTVARWRANLRAALNYGADELGGSVPPLRAIRYAEAERVAYLSETQEALLLAAYSPAAALVMRFLCETGARTQEALRLDWRHVDWARNVVLIEHTGLLGGPRTKSGRSRRIGMRPVVRMMLLNLWNQKKRPEAGNVFLNRWGRPYADTRQVGGNPLSSAHRTACRAAGIIGFRIHDWRHHWAVWFLKRGGDVRSLCQIAGWSSMRMVSRYAVYEQSDLDDVMVRTARPEPIVPDP